MLSIRPVAALGALWLWAAFAAAAQTAAPQAAAESPTYAERLGFPKGARVLIFHGDDAGMSHNSNTGSIEAMEKGVVTSVSIMMPTPWVPEIVRYAKSHPSADFGLHLTLTSEWDLYRWGPVAGKPAVPGLVDEEGAMWDGVGQVIEHASADEVEREIRAQIDRAKTMQMPITHMDSHMGTLFASPKFFERYMKVGIETGIPILVAGGHLQHASKENPLAVALLRPLAAKCWEGGLPVLDDIHTDSYGWKTPEEKITKYIEFLRTMKPGVTETIVHTAPMTPEFPTITDSAPIRNADFVAMTSPEVRKAIETEGIILTTWKELMERRRTAKP